MKGIQISFIDLKLPDVWAIMSSPTGRQSTWTVINEFEDDMKKEETLPNGYPDFRHMTKITVDEISEVIWGDIEYD